MDYLAREHDVIPIKIGTMSRQVSGIKDLVTLWQLIKVFRREKPTVVHTHTAKAGTLGRLAAMVTKVPVRVHTFHGHVFRGYFSPLVSRIFIKIERFLARHTDRIIAISESQKYELTEIYRIAPRENISVIPLGFDLDRFLASDGRPGGLRRSLSCEGGAFLIGFVGRLTGIKDPDLFLSCAGHLINRAGSTRFVLVGDGELRKRCEDRVAAEGMGEVVSIIGWQKHLPDIYADLDLVVLTSLNEGTPVVLLEAMASGKAFVSTDVGGVRDLMVGPSRPHRGFEIFQNGILVPRNAEVLAHAIAYLMAKPGIRTGMGQVGRKFVKARFCGQRLADDLEALYLSLARARKDPQAERPTFSSASRIEVRDCSFAQQSAHRIPRWPSFLFEMMKK